MAALIQVTGAAQIKAALGRVDKDFQGELKVTHRRVSDLIVALAEPNTPVGKTGRLKRSVRALASQRDARVAAGNNSAVDYASAIHWGRKRGGVIVGRPWLWDAAQQATPAAVALYERDVTALIDRAITVASASSRL